MADFNPTATTHEEVSKLISARAAEIASAKVRERPDLWPYATGELYREATLASTQGGLCIIYEDSLMYRNGQLDPDLEVILQRIGADAIPQALIEKGDLFVGLIVADARKGQNYFRRFGNEGDQMGLF